MQAFFPVWHTVLNYLLIFGKAGFQAMGVKGAAWSSVMAQAAGCILTVIFFSAVESGGKSMYNS